MIDEDNSMRTVTTEKLEIAEHCRLLTEMCIEVGMGEQGETVLVSLRELLRNAQRDVLDIVHALHDDEIYFEESEDAAQCDEL